MKEIGVKNPKANLNQHEISSTKTIYWNQKPKQLAEDTLRRNQGTLSYNGTLTIHTGQFTGRSPKDRYIVKDEISQSTVDWNDINQPIDPNHYSILFDKITAYLSDKRDLFVKDAAICNNQNHQLKVRVIAEHSWSAHFVHNMFIRLNEEEIINFSPDWVIYVAPGLKANPETDGVRAKNFSIINFEKKEIIIGGTGYTGEIKKGMFSVLNYNLPMNDVLSMHCSANVGKNGESAVFFGLSGTGKTTLSADPNRELIGDDEHGWSDEGVFNFEGGCYAKCIGLRKENEPDIYRAIRPGAILENIKFFPGTSRPNFDDASITQNTRVSYPIHHIANHYGLKTASTPKNIFFLTCDAFGILPPLSKLSPEQAMFYFISGYTAKVAGTEEGIAEPKATFSACFGAPFLPLHPNSYAQLLGEKIKKHDVNIWLVNTGWIGGEYGIGNRISIKHTRALINAVLDGKLEDVSYTNFNVFNLQIPSFCPDVPGEILHPRNSWADKDAYNKKRIELAEMFNKNFNHFEKEVSEDIKAAAPNLMPELIA